MVHTIIYFIIATVSCIFFNSFFSNFRLIFYSPFLVMLLFRNTFITSLWWACLSGVIVDIFSSSIMGINAFSYAIVVLILYKQKKNFKETPLNIAIFTIVISVAYTFIYFILSLIFEKNIKPSWMLTDITIMPFLDAIYAILFFVFPIQLFELLKRRIFLK